MKIELTDHLAETLGPGLYWDAHKRSPDGFLLQVTTGGSRTYRLNYRRQSDNRERRLTIGGVAEFPVERGAKKRGQAQGIDLARQKAAELRRAIREGRDPLGEREAKRAEPTVAELVQRFEAEALPSRAPRTQAEYKAQFRDWVLPTLGKMKVTSVEREDIERLHRRITEAGKPRRANSVKSLCSTLFTQAIIWKMRDTNPTQYVKGNREDHHERFLSGEELDRLMAVLEGYREKRPDSVDAITVAVLTGSRRGEILGMRWRDLDLEAGIWLKPPEATKQRKPHHLTLSGEAVEVLRRRRAERDAQAEVRVVRLRRDDRDDFVFKDGGSKTHANRFEGDWREIRAAAGLQDCRFHDLRHSVASWLIAAGMSLPVVGSVLGHSKAATTQRYAHLSDAAQRQAVDLVGALVGGKRAK